MRKRTPFFFTDMSLASTKPQPPTMTKCLCRKRDAEVPVWVLRKPPAHWGWLALAGAQGGVLRMQLVPLLEPEAVSAPPVDLISAEPTAPAVAQAGSLLGSAQ